MVEGERSETATQVGSRVPDPEVAPRAKRRRLTARYKAGVLELVDGFTDEDGNVDQEQLGALLRREGLYSSSIEKWQKQRRNGGLEALGRTGGRPSKSQLEVAYEKLQSENAALERQLKQLRALLELQKKCFALLGLEPEPHTNS
jgi:hypothetical protein